MSIPNPLIIVGILIRQHFHWQPSRLRVLRGVVEGVAEEARTRGFASLGFPRFAFIGFSYSAPVTIRPLPQASNLTFVVDDMPSYVAIDPYNKLIDRNSDDNVEQVDEMTVQFRR